MVENSLSSQILNLIGLDFLYQQIFVGILSEAIEKLDNNLI